MDSVFRFFQSCIHFDDKQSEIKDCKTRKRRDDYRSRKEVDDMKYTDIDDINNESNLWILREKITQYELDQMHSYLAHPNWDIYKQRYVIK